MIKLLDISCLGSCYLETNPRELYFALMSIFINDAIPKQTLLVLDGPINNKLLEVINYFIENYKIEILELNKNQGLGNALSEGLKKCKFEYVARFDTDDINLPNRLEKQYKFLKNNPKISVLGSNVMELRKKGGFYENRLKRVPISNINIILGFFYRNCINHPTVLFIRSDILKIGNYTNRIFFEDYDLWLRLFDKGYKFANFSEPLVLMKRDDASLRRKGISYLKKELIFIKNLRFQIIKKILLYCIFLFRIICRYILPAEFQNLLPWRSEWEPINKEYLRYIKLLDKKYKKSFKKK